MAGIAGAFWLELYLIFEEDRRLESMKKILLLTAVLAIGVFGLGCPPAADNTNTNANDNASPEATMEASPEMTPADNTNTGDNTNAGGNTNSGGNTNATNSEDNSAS